jgi:uncharacterized membrane protein YhaH (DUF805 family)
MASTRHEERSRNNWALLLLLIPFVALLVPQLYASLDPRFLGLSFFLWYQMLWVLLGAAITGVVYWLRG